MELYRPGFRTWIAVFECSSVATAMNEIGLRPFLHLREQLYKK